VVADIPETEIFRHVDNEQIPMLQFAASAAHLTGKNLVSAESFTWLDEHFQVKPRQLKEAADFLWLGGVNHLFFHGIPYNPEGTQWPGWLFYASTHMGQNGGLWRDLPAFNRYLETVQRELQKGEPDTAVLLYFPIHDLWSQPSDKLPLFTIHNQDQWLHGTSFRHREPHLPRLSERPPHRNLLLPAAPIQSLWLSQIRRKHPRHRGHQSCRQPHC
jgi:hypothetical protein